MVTFVLSAEPLFVGIVFRKYVMVWEVFNTLFMNIWNVGDREPVQSCPALFIMVWEVPNIIILLTLFIMVWEVPNIIILEPMWSGKSLILCLSIFG